MKSLKILVAPLDWGLGHTTRCLPLIRYLQQQGHTVIAAAEGHAARLLQENFPQLEVLALPGYRIGYSKHKRMFTSKLLLQIPKIVRAIKAEHRWLRQMQEDHHFDGVISDNRYGCYLPSVPSVILTHQLQIQTGLGSWADRRLRYWHYTLLKKFQQCWVVDVAGAHGLSGKLAHPDVLPGHAHYLGLLSQCTMFAPTPGTARRPSYVLALLSGPEPMRSQLAQILLRQMAAMPQQHFVLVAGNPSIPAPAQLPAHITYYTHLNAAQVHPLIVAASLVICRSGYTTLMDLTLLQKKALLIPTPGQTEQEYLAAYHRKQHGVHTCTQQELRLDRDMPIALDAPAIGMGLEASGAQFMSVADAWLLSMASA